METFRLWLTRLQWSMVLLVIVTSTWWWRVKWWQNLSAPSWLHLHDLYFVPYGFSIFVLLSFLAWLLTGCRGLSNTLVNGNILWLIPLFQLAIWTRISYGDDTLNPTVALSSATMWIAVALFTLSVTANPPPIKWILGAFVVGMLIQGLLGLAQVIVQHDLGIYAFNDKLGFNTGIGELPLNPDASGVSVVIGNGIRVLRPYGFGAHPNMTVPAIVVGFFAGLVWWNRHWAAALLVIAWWSILLSFGRAALGGVVVGMAAMAGLWMVTHFLPYPKSLPASREGLAADIGSPPRLRGGVRGWGNVALLLVLTTALFIGMYAPMLGIRFGVQNTGEATFQDYSAASRAAYQEQAIQIIKENPWLGVGIGNMAWHSALMLQYDPRDLRGQPVHNIYLLALSEVGIIGFALFMVTLGIGFALMVRRAWLGKLTTPQFGLWGAAIALLAMGWFDHYLWSQFGHLLLFWTIFAVMLHKQDSP